MKENIHSSVCSSRLQNSAKQTHYLLEGSVKFAFLCHVFHWFEFWNVKSSFQPASDRGSSHCVQWHEQKIVSWAAGETVDLSVGCFVFCFFCRIYFLQDNLFSDLITFIQTGCKVMRSWWNEIVEFLGFWGLISLLCFDSGTVMDVFVSHWHKATLKWALAPRDVVFFFGFSVPFFIWSFLPHELWSHFLSRKWNQASLTALIVWSDLKICSIKSQCFET